MPSFTWAGNYGLSGGSTPASRGSATADFNGDGWSDTATLNYETHTVSLLLSNGDGTVSDAGTVAIGPFPSVVTPHQMPISKLGAACRGTVAARRPRPQREGNAATDRVSRVENGSAPASDTPRPESTQARRSSIERPCRHRPETNTEDPSV